MLQLPAGYRAADVLAYHGRDPESPAEHVRGMTLVKALAFGGDAVVLEVELEPHVAWCRVHADARVIERHIAGVHAVALRCSASRSTSRGSRRGRRVIRAWQR
jgi:DNA-3-methyladenine glycosylase II